MGELAEEKIGLAIDNSRIPAQQLNEILESIRSPGWERPSTRRILWPFPRDTNSPSGY